MSKLILRAAIVLGALSFNSPAELAAQESAGPEGLPPEIAQMLGEAAASGGEVTVAPAEEPPGAAAAIPGLAGNRYLYTTLRVITSGNPRGCGHADWACMANLCKTDLQDTSAWRGWAGCWREDSNYICYFDCDQAREAF
jgi:hypothetical protein